MEQENLRYIGSVLQGERPTARPDWWETLGFLQCHKIAGMFYKKAIRLSLALPHKIERILQNIFYAQARKAKHMRSYLGELAQTLCRKNVPHAILKGSALCNVQINGIEIYADGERVSNDIDVLAMPEDLDAVCAVLKDLGYVQGVYDRETDTVRPFARAEILRRRLNRGEVAPFVKRTDNAEFPFMEIDVNFSLGNTPDDGAPLLREMVRTAKLYSGKIELCTLTPEMFFLQLIMHQYKESCLYFAVERGKDLDAYKLADILYVYKAVAARMSNILEIAQKFGVIHRVGAVLRQVGELFGDQAVLQTAKECGDAQPRVIDYAAKKEYVWQGGIRERLSAFDAMRFLREV